MVPYVALKAYEFPHINLVWFGTIIMIGGFAVSVRRRYLLTGTLTVSKRPVAASHKV